MALAASVSDRRAHVEAWRLHRPVSIPQEDAEEQGAPLGGRVGGHVHFMSEPPTLLLSESPSAQVPSKSVRA